MAEFNWWKVCTFLSQQIETLLVVLRQILLFFGWGNEFSLSVVGTEQHGDGESCTYRVSNLFTLWIKCFWTGFFFTAFYEQEEGISTWKKHWANLMFSILQDRKLCLLLESERTISVKTWYCRTGIVGHSSEILLCFAPTALSISGEFQFWGFSHLEDLSCFLFLIHFIYW